MIYMKVSKTRGWKFN